jgi:hypothetical protein
MCWRETISESAGHKMLSLFKNSARKSLRVNENGNRTAGGDASQFSTPCCA